MKKIIKSKIFSLFLGIIVSTGIYVTAATIRANNIAYNNGTVQDALSTLYQRGNIPKYNGEYYFDPNPNEDIIVPTSGLLVKGNIGVNRIPSQYKCLSNTTTATADDIALGKTAYNNNGELITGTFAMNGECKFTSFTCTTCNTTQVVPLDFTPTKFMLYSDSFNTTGFLYDADFDPTKVRHKENGLINLSQVGEIGENNFTIKSWHPANNTVKYRMIYCK